MDNQIHILFVMMFICLTSAALRFQVTQEDCVRSIDLSKENRVIIDYADSDFRNMTGVCIIDITSSSSSEMICITSDRAYLIDSMCTWSLSYHIGRYSQAYYGGEEYSCNDFNRKHLCKNTRRVALAYSDNFLFQNVTISVTLFLKTYIPTTTRRPYRHWSSWSPWSWSSWSPSSWSSWSPSSWSSWTSSNDDDEDKYQKSGSGSTIIMFIIAAIGCVILLIVLVISCSKKLTHNNHTDSSPPVRYSPESEHIDDSVRPAGACSKPEQDPPTYEECEKYKPVYEPGTNNEQPLRPDTENPTIPSAPPPPYPGYLV